MIKKTIEKHFPLLQSNKTDVKEYLNNNDSSFEIITEKIIINCHKNDFTTHYLNCDDYYTDLYNFTQSSNYNVNQTTYRNSSNHHHHNNDNNILKCNGTENQFTFLCKKYFQPSCEFQFYNLNESKAFQNININNDNNHNHNHNQINNHTVCKFN